MGTTADKLQGILDSKADIKDAIEAKGVSVGDAKLSEYAGKIAEISGGGQEESPENDVNFYDYDGFRVASFTIAEAKALTQAEYDAILPPSHEGLTFQEWNWTLNDIATYDRQYIDVGANYITTDGKTWMRVKATDTSVVLGIRGLTSLATVDWGDGTESSYQFPSYNQSHAFTHNYSQLGDYVIKINVSNSGFTFENRTNQGYWKGLELKELRLSDFFAAQLNYITNDCIVSIPKTSAINSIAVGYTLVRQVTFPRSEDTILTTYQALVNTFAQVCMPRRYAGFTNTFFWYNWYGNRLILPEVSSEYPIVNNLIGNINATVVSFPTANYSTSPSNKYFSDNFLCVFDVPNGWIPSQNLTFSDSRLYAAQNMVDFFNKLGTTSTAITLTFGVNNLNKLTAAQKAIATDKGYTLA